MTDIPVESLIELIGRQKQRMDDSIRALGSLRRDMAARVIKTGRWSALSKFAVVILGAIIATRVVADSLFPSTTPGSIPQIEIPYTVLSVLIAIVSGLDTVFKPGEVTTELSLLSVTCEGTEKEVEQRWAIEVERLGVSREALDHTDELLAKLDGSVTAARTRLAQLRVATSGQLQQ